MRVVPNMTHDHDPDHMTVAGNKTSPVRCDRCQIAPRLPVAEASQRVMSVKWNVQAVHKKSVVCSYSSSLKKSYWKTVFS